MSEMSDVVKFVQKTLKVFDEIMAKTASHSIIKNSNYKFFFGKNDVMPVPPDALGDTAVERKIEKPVKRKSNEFESILLNDESSAFVQQIKLEQKVSFECIVFFWFKTIDK